MVARVRPIRAGTWSAPVADPVQALEDRLAALRVAQSEGRDHGYRIGYMTGWRWGVLCGVVPGILLGAALVAVPVWLGVLAGGL